MVGWLRSGTGEDALLSGIPNRDEGYARMVPLLRDYLQFGAMPAIVDEDLTAADARHLRHLDSILDRPIPHSLVLSSDGQIKELEPGIAALPVGWFLGPG